MSRISSTKSMEQQPEMTQDPYKHMHVQAFKDWKDELESSHVHGCGAVVAGHGPGQNPKH